MERHVRLKSRQRGFSESQMVESFLALLAAGGDCPEDFESFRGDSGLHAARSVLKRLWRSVRAYWRKRLKQWRTGQPRSTLKRLGSHT